MEQTRFPKIVMVWAFLLCLGGSMECFAQTKPLWINRGEKSMNKKRLSDSYLFKVFNTHGQDESKLRAERLTPLLQYLESEYGVETSQMVVDTAAVASDGSKVTKISMTTGDSTSVVYAKLVDDYDEFTDYELNVFQHEYYQLYAVTASNAAPVFDEFRIEEVSNAQALARSIVPGLGQLYKGQTAKGCAIMGAEAFFIGSAIVFECKRDYYADKGWRSKARSWKEFRNIAIAGAGIVYIYNLIDAATAKAGHRVKVGKAGNVNVSLVPTPTLGAGVSLAWTF